MSSPPLNISNEPYLVASIVNGPNVDHDVNATNLDHDLQESHQGTPSTPDLLGMARNFQIEIDSHRKFGALWREKYHQLTIRTGQLESQLAIKSDELEFMSWEKQMLHNTAEERLHQLNTRTAQLDTLSSTNEMLESQLAQKSEQLDTATWERETACAVAKQRLRSVQTMKADLTAAKARQLYHSKQPVVLVNCASGHPPVWFEWALLVLVAVGFGALLAGMYQGVRAILVCIF